MNNDAAVIILAAGLGTRMKSRKAKVLHRVAGETLLNCVIDAALHLVAPEKVVVVVGYQAEEVRQSVQNPRIQFVEQREQRGTGHAVQCAAEVAQRGDRSVLVLNGDGPLLTPQTLERLVESQQEVPSGAAIVTTIVDDPFGYGRIVRSEGDRIAAIVEQKATTADQAKIREINSGLYCFDGTLLWECLDELQPHSASGEIYLTDLVSILGEHGAGVRAVLCPDSSELLGINTRVELAEADTILRRRKARQLMLEGVTIEDPGSVAIDLHVQVGIDSVVEANVQLRGSTAIGENCRIGAGSILRDCAIADDVTIFPYVVAESSRIGSRSYVGPFARLRQQAEAGDATHIGNFVELKNTRLGHGSKANHLAYLGDADIGSQVNIGAGSITCNYDGLRKHPTHIKDGVFVGSNSTLVAPVTISERAYVAAGSVITKNVEAGSLAIGRAHQVEKSGWVERRSSIKKTPSA